MSEQETHTFTFGAHLGVYAVAFLDLLGQKAAMRKLEPAFQAFVNSPHLYETKDQDKILADPAAQGVMAAMSQSILAVRSFSERFELYASDTMKALDAWLEKASPDDHKVPMRFAWPGIKSLRFSDGLVLYAPMSPPESQGFGAGLFHLLMTCGYLWAAQLAEGQPIRGGVDVAVGVELEGEELLGPALVEAYILESEIADYPRIVVGKGVGSFLERMIGEYSRDENFHLDQKLAYMTRELLYQAPDGASMVHVLGTRFRQLGHQGLNQGTLDKARAFVFGEYDRWKSDESKLGRRIFGKYERLRRYFERY